MSRRGPMLFLDFLAQSLLDFSSQNFKFLRVFKLRKLLIDHVSIGFGVVNTSKKQTHHTSQAENLRLLHQF